VLHKERDRGLKTGGASECMLQATRNNVTCRCRNTLKLSLICAQVLKEWFWKCAVKKLILSIQ